MINEKFQKRILVIGVPDMAYIGVDTLVRAGVNIVGVMGPLSNHTTFNDFKSFTKSRNLNFIEYNDFNSPELHKTIKELNVDLGVVFSFNHKLPMSFINLIKDGILNLHPSLLPEYRGGNPYSRVILNGENETGVTIHFLSENFDEGDIVAQIKCPIESNDTMGTIFNNTNYLGTRLMLSAINEYEKTGTLPRKPQPEGEFKSAKNLKNEEFHVDFNKTAVEIERQIRALNPYLNCYTYYKGQVIKLYKASVEDCTPPENAVNGEIFKIEDNKLYIKTKSGAICPQIIQYSGLFVGDIVDFIKIVKPSVGDRFGNG